MSIDNAIASLAVNKVAPALAWYETLIGRPPDSTPMPGVGEWQFPRGGWLQVYEHPERAGGGSVTLAVSDINELEEHLRRLGLEPGRRTSSTKVMTVMVEDPDGNQITFAQAHDPTMAR